MNVLILGGNGYLGSKVTKRIISQGHMVVCTRRSESNMSKLVDVEKNIVWIPAKIESVIASMQYTKFDYVLNMACNYGRSSMLYDDVLEANIGFPLKVLNAAVEHGTKHFMTIGTGLPDDFNMYSFSKKMFSQFGKFYVEKHDIDFNCLLLEMFYGADEPRDRFIPATIVKMLKGDPVDITIGTQYRDIISISDVVDAVMMVFNAMPKGFNEISVGTGVAATISQIVDFIWEQTGKKSIINKGAIQLRENEPNCIADNRFIETLSEWKPIDWKIGIAKMIEDIKEELEAER